MEEEIDSHSWRMNDFTEDQIDTLKHEKVELHMMHDMKFVFVYKIK